MIARLKKERDEARSLLSQAERQVPVAQAAINPMHAPVHANGKRGILFFFSVLLMGFSNEIHSLLYFVC